jgi:hypothetical protein
LERVADAKGRFRRPRGSGGAGRDAVPPLTLPLVDLKRQYLSIKEEIDAALLDTVASTHYILGDAVARFEEEFAAYCGVRCCVGVGSGTAAIHLTLEALGVSDGDEVIVPANTFFGTVLPVMRLRATPVLVDCDRQTATIDVDLVSKAISSRTKAVLAVHLYGHPSDMDPLQELCTSHGVFLVEDACQAHGARYKERRAGALGKAAAFSSIPPRILARTGTLARSRLMMRNSPTASSSCEISARQTSTSMSQKGGMSASTRFRPPCSASSCGISTAGTRFVANTPRPTKSN